MFKLETIHQAMNHEHVQEAARSLHFDWLFAQFALDDTALIKDYLTSHFCWYAGYTPTEEQVAAAETLFRMKVASGQAWYQ